MTEDVVDPTAHPGAVKKQAEEGLETRVQSVTCFFRR